MPTLLLSAEQRRALRARAHALKPVVSISQNGLSEAVLKEIGVALYSHQLIKVRVFNDDREERERHLAAICEHFDAAPVQHIGKLLVVWRPGDESTTPRSGYAKRRPPRRTKRSFQSET
jgi:putative YhbY family RNA-binding protein